MTTDPRTTLGRRGEQLAAEHFERLGWEIVARNYRTRFGELDLVAVDGDTARLRRGQDLSRRPRPAVGEPARVQAGQVRRMASIWLAEVAAATLLPPPPLRRGRGRWSTRDDRLVRLDHLRGAF